MLDLLVSNCVNRSILSIHSTLYVIVYLLNDLSVFTTFSFLEKGSLESKSMFFRFLAFLYMYNKKEVWEIFFFVPKTHFYNILQMKTTKNIIPYQMAIYSRSSIRNINNWRLWINKKMHCLI